MTYLHLTLRAPSMTVEAHDENGALQEEHGAAFTKETLLNDAMTHIPEAERGQAVATWEERYTEPA